MLIHKYTKQLFRSFLLLSIAVVTLLFSSCEDQVGPPEIYQVRSTDPEKADSTFPGSEPGKLIVVQGKNFTGLLHVYLNGIDAPFNPAFQSDNNILVWIPADVPLSAISPDAPNTIRVVTQTGETSFDFRYLAPAPFVEYFDFDIPLTVGQDLSIVGSNFYEVKRVFFQRNGDTTDIDSYTLSETYERITFTITDFLQYNGELGVVTESGVSVKTYTPNPPPEIYGFSNDLPVQGDTFSVKGIYLSGVIKVIFPDGTEVESDGFTINGTSTKMTIGMPESNISGDLLFITAFDDTTVYSGFNSRSMVMYDFDGKGNWVWDASKIQTAGTQAGEEPLLANGQFYRLTATVPINTDWWDPGIWGMSVTWPEYTAIPQATPISDLGISILVNTELPWTQGYLNIGIGSDATGWMNYQLMPYEDGNEIPIDKWMLYTIPFADFDKMPFSTYGDLVSLGTVNVVLVRFLTTNSEEEFDIDLCLDDLRLSYIE